jgi:ferredoxin
MTIKIDRLRCIGCGACTYICPVEALEVVDMKCAVNDKCISCGKCVTTCTWEALTLDKEPITKGPGEK